MTRMTNKTSKINSPKILMASKITNKALQEYYIKKHGFFPKYKTKEL
jgi:hypothetical protein